MNGVNVDIAHVGTPTTCRNSRVATQNYDPIHLLRSKYESRVANICKDDSLHTTVIRMSIYVRRYSMHCGWGWWIGRHTYQANEARLNVGNETRGDDGAAPWLGVVRSRVGVEGAAQSILVRREEGGEGARRLPTAHHFIIGMLFLALSDALVQRMDVRRLNKLHNILSVSMNYFDAGNAYMRHLL